MGRGAKRRVSVRPGDSVCNIKRCSINKGKGIVISIEEKGKRTYYRIGFRGINETILYTRNDFWKSPAMPKGLGNKRAAMACAEEVVEFLPYGDAYDWSMDELAGIIQRYALKA